MPGAGMQMAMPGMQPGMMPGMQQGMMAGMPGMPGMPGMAGAQPGRSLAKSNSVVLRRTETRRVSSNVPPNMRL